MSYYKKKTCYNMKLVFCMMWTLCLLGLVLLTSAAPEEALEDFGGESGSGMLHPGNRPDTATLLATVYCFISAQSRLKTKG